MALASFTASPDFAESASLHRTIFPAGNLTGVELSVITAIRAHISNVHKWYRGRRVKGFPDVERRASQHLAVSENDARRELAVDGRCGHRQDPRRDIAGTARGTGVPRGGRHDNAFRTALNAPIAVVSM